MGAFARNIRPHVGAAAKTAFGRVPRGNTGGANVSPFAPMPIPPGRGARLRAARAAAG